MDSATRQFSSAKTKRDWLSELHTCEKANYLSYLGSSPFRIAFCDMPCYSDLMTTRRAVEDPHTVLGVARNASMDDIKKAYRREVRRVHPDMGGTSAMFDRVRIAYLALLGQPAAKNTSTPPAPCTPTPGACENVRLWESSRRVAQALQQEKAREAAAAARLQEEKEFLARFGITE
jgi:DnaJ domain